MHPVLFEFGPITLYAFGVALAIAFLGATLFGQWMVGRAQRLGAQHTLSPAHVADLAFWILVSGILGARALYVITHASYYRQHPADVLAIWHGGLIFYGGLVCALMTAVWYVKRQRVSVGHTADLITPMIPLGQSIGRVGCFLNGCCYGRPTDGPWGVLFLWSDVPRYPTQLFESAATLLLAILFSAWNFRRRIWERPRGGRVLLTYFICYAVWRFGIEFLRGDNPIVAGGLNLPQWVSVLLIVASSLWLWRIRQVAHD